MRSFLNWSLPIFLSAPGLVSAAAVTDLSVSLLQSIVQEYSPRTLIRAQTKNGFEWQFGSASAVIQKTFENTIDKKHWIKTEILINHSFVENGLSKRFVLLRQRPTLLKKTTRANIPGWLDGMIFVEKKGKWEKEASGYNLGYVTRDHFDPSTDFRVVSLSAKHPTFVIRQDTTPKDMTLELTEYYITALNRTTLKKVAEIIVTQHLASPEPDGTFRHDTATVEIIAPQLETLSPFRVKTLLQWVNPQNKVVRQQMDAIFYQFDPQSNEYVVQSTQ